MAGNSDFAGFSRSSLFARHQVGAIVWFARKRTMTLEPIDPETAVELYIAEKETELAEARGQITLLKEVYERDEESGCRVANLSTGFDGGMKSSSPGVGAFGNRINATPEVTGEPSSSAFFERKEIDGETHYRLRSEAREEMEEYKSYSIPSTGTLCLTCSNRGQKLALQSLNPKATVSVVF